MMFPIGFVFGLIVTLRNGLRTYVQHRLLRWLLVRSGSTPKDYVAFLDFCAERILLRRVGGGYLFIHRMLLEYFAALPADQVNAPATAQ